MINTLCSNPCILKTYCLHISPPIAYLQADVCTNHGIVEALSQWLRHCEDSATSQTFVLDENTALTYLHPKTWLLRQDNLVQEDTSPYRLLTQFTKRANKMS